MNGLKIKKIHFKIPITYRSHKMTLSSDDYSLEYIPELSAYFIDKTILVHTENVNEIIVEQELDKKKK